MRLQLVGGVLVSLLLAGCSRPYFREDEVVLGVSIDWREQQDRESVDTLIALCAARVGGGRLLTGARIRFTDDASRDCQLAQEVGGCWRFDSAITDLVIVEVRPTLAQTATCHELGHRARFFAHGQVPGSEDPFHCDPDLWPALDVPADPRCFTRTP